MEITGEELVRVTHFKCLRTSTEEECCMATEVTVRMGPGWINWKKCRRGTVRRRMPTKLIRPAMVYGAETLATTKRQENGIQVNEMRMLRWMFGVTRKYKIWNEHLRGTTRVAQASKKITERRSNW